MEQRAINDDIINALVEIGNHKRVIEVCEPNINEPLALKPWMVKRTLKAQELFRNEWERYTENTRGTVSEASISVEGSVCSDT